MACVYRSPNSNVSKFTKHLDALLDIANKEHKSLLLCGDFNIDTLKNTTSSQNMLTTIAACNFEALITRPTRTTNHSSSCIDNIIMNISHKVTSYGIIETDISDHYAVFACLNLTLPSKVSKNITKAFRRRFTEYNKSLFSSLISNEQWSSVYNEIDVNKKYNAFINTFSHYMNSCFPVNLVTIKTNKKCPWFNSIAKQLNRIKHKLLRLSKSFPNLIPIYKKLQTHYKTYIKLIKNRYYQEHFKKCQNNPRKTWNTINNITGRTKDKSQSNFTLQTSNETLSDPEEVATYFNKHFCSIGANLNPGNLKFPSNNSTVCIHQGQINSFVLFDITEDEIFNSISTLKPHASPGYDDITPMLIKLAAPHISKVLLHIFNASFSTGTFPTRMKTAKIIPIFKKGNKLDVNNYRPISLLPIFSKCLEKIMSNRLNSFLSKYKIISPSQFGFSKNKSTVDAIISFMEKIKINPDSHIISIFCDLSKAFDCVNHNILLQKLYNLGIRGTPYKWFESYLLERNQYTVITKSRPGTSQNYSILTKFQSKISQIKQGVPQGSILGPLLFNIYINDLPQNRTIPADYILYADDTNVIISADDPKTLENKFNSLVTDTEKWLRNNQLCLNTTKTNYMLINPQNRNNNTPLTINNTHNINRVEEIKFLGLNITDKFSWNEHIHHVIKKIKPGIATLYKLREVAELPTLLQIYYSLIHSHLAYSILIWGNAPHTYLDKLLKIQKKAIRIITRSSPLTSCRPLFQKHNILTVFSLYVLEASCYVKKCLLQPDVNSVSSIIQAGNIHSHNTRQQNNIFIHNSTNRQKKTNLNLQCALIYNKLPDHLKQIPNINTFKAKTKYLLLNNALYGVHELDSLKNKT